MATKYIKLFENWLLSESDRETEFDSSKPHNWPVMDTTIAHLREADSKGNLEKLFETLFRRATNKDVWDENAGENFNVTYRKVTPLKKYNWVTLFYEYMETVGISKEQIRNNKEDYFDSGNNWESPFKNTKFHFGPGIFGFENYGKRYEPIGLYQTIIEKLNLPKDDDPQNANEVKNLIEKIKNIKEEWNKTPNNRSKFKTKGQIYFRKNFLNL